jgi:hypothetical protein
LKILKNVPENLKDAGKTRIILMGKMGQNH